MRSLVSWSLKFRHLVVLVAVGILVVGATQLRDMPVDVLPEFTPGYVEVQTEALGLSAAEVEELITVPLEGDLLNGVAGIDVIRSESVAGLSRIVLVIEPGTDVMDARQLVQERLTQAHALPNVSKPPAMLQPLSSSSRVLMVGLRSDELSMVDLGLLARWTIRPRLLGVPGVANVAMWGQREHQLQVQVDPERLRARDVSLEQIVSTTGNSQLVSPLSFLEGSTPGTGGFIDTPNQRLQVRHILPITTPEGLARVPVDGAEGGLRLGDVTTIVEDHQPLIGDASVADSEGILLVVEKFPGANTLEVTDGVQDALDALRPGLAGVEVDSTVFRRGEFDRNGDRQPHARAALRLPPALPRTRPVHLRLADRGRRLRLDRDVRRRCAGRNEAAWRDDERAASGRARAGRGRGRGRRRRHGREHRSPPACFAR